MRPANRKTRLHAVGEIQKENFLDFSDSFSSLYGRFFEIFVDC